MKYVFFDAKTGLSGDMILGALLDLGIKPALFRSKMAGLKLPVRIEIKETDRSHFRGLKVDVHVKDHGSHARKWKDIAALIKKSDFSQTVKERGLAVFKNLFEAEAKVHGCRFEDTHLHEAGADDALIDVIGCAWLAEELAVGEFYCSPLNVGEGWIKTSHGVLPVPPPAVAELLKGVPVYSAHAKAELVTPTGAAIVKTLVKKFIPFPELIYGKIGYGAGSREIHGLPNILRVFYGDAARFSPDKQVYLIEATIDDSNPQVLASFMDRALELGALDVYLTPVVMKKNRLGTKLTLLAALDRIDGLITAVFRETSSIGVRYHPVERRALERTIKTIRLFGEPVGIKISTLGGEPVNVQPEFSDCLTVARKKGLPVKDVLRLALKEFSKKG
ncbi:MAG: nickel pincer cofactor biosynthesis protein LarC [Candidatus Aminicenantes bacterium]|nr:nickel pincer cofactor biosynthesis protein LarC [Candidatus Aminicenantes bacterium]